MIIYKLYFEFILKTCTILTADNEIKFQSSASAFTKGIVSYTNV